MKGDAYEYSKYIALDQYAHQNQRNGHTHADSVLTLLTPFKASLR